MKESNILKQITLYVSERGAYHAECEAYKAFRAEKEKEYEERLKGYSNYKRYPKKRS